MIKTEKILHLRSSRGRRVRVVREHYLRARVPCYSCLCQADCANGTHARTHRYTRTHTSAGSHANPGGTERLRH